MKIDIPIPKAFYDDYATRGHPAPRVWRTLSRNHIIDSQDSRLFDFFVEARQCAGQARSDHLGIRTSAQATVRAIERHLNVALRNDEAFLLTWLSNADSSALGECRSIALDRLVNLGMATVDNATRGDYARVKLTGLGLVEAWRRRNRESR